MMTRRQTVRLFAAAALAPMLPMGRKPAVLAAESGAAFDVLDNAEAEREIVKREQWHMITFPEDYNEMPGCLRCFVERLSDGSARLIFEAPNRNATQAEMQSDAGRFTANPRHILHDMRLDAATLADLDFGMQLYRACRPAPA